jgi:hypothetical protein
MRLRRKAPRLAGSAVLGKWGTLGAEEEARFPWEALTGHVGAPQRRGAGVALDRPLSSKLIFLRDTVWIQRSIHTHQRLKANHVTLLHKSRLRGGG